MRNAKSNDRIHTSYLFSVKVSSLLLHLVLSFPIPSYRPYWQSKKMQNLHLILSAPLHGSIHPPNFKFKSTQKIDITLFKKNTYYNKEYFYTTFRQLHLLSFFLSLSRRVSHVLPNALFTPFISKSCTNPTTPITLRQPPRSPPSAAFTSNSSGDAHLGTPQLGPISSISYAPSISGPSNGPTSRP